MRFKPGGARCVFDFPLSEISDSVIPLDQILGNIICDLRDKHLGTAEAKFAALSQFSRPPARTAFAASGNSFCLFANAPASLTVKQISESCGISQKHFIQQFRRSVGKRPKPIRES
ncbi:MAG: helix-turn-helix transcriptional regulator [Calditrichia bacterium]